MVVWDDQRFVDPFTFVRPANQTHNSCITSSSTDCVYNVLASGAHQRTSSDLLGHAVLVILSSPGQYPSHSHHMGGSWGGGGKICCFMFLPLVRCQHLLCGFRELSCNTFRCQHFRVNCFLYPLILLKNHIITASNCRIIS